MAEPRPLKETYFAEVKTVYTTTMDPVVRRRVLDAGIATARWRAENIAADIAAKRAPAVVAVRARYEANAHLGDKGAGRKLEINPFVGVPPNLVEDAYRSRALSGGAARRHGSGLLSSLRKG